MIDIKDTIKGVDLSINDINSKLTANEKAAKILNLIDLKVRKITIKKGNLDLPVIKTPYHKITLYLDITKFDREKFAKKIGLSKFHIHMNEEVITKGGIVDVKLHKKLTGKISKYSSITILI
jgi:hypothetical protein